MGASLGACMESKSPKQRGQGTTIRKAHSCKARKTSGQAIRHLALPWWVKGCFPLFTAPRNPEMQEEKLVLLPMLQASKPSVHLSSPFGGTGTV